MKRPDSRIGFCYATSNAVTSPSGRASGEGEGEADGTVVYVFTPTRPLPAATASDLRCAGEVAERNKQIVAVRSANSPQGSRSEPRQ